MFIYAIMLCIDWDVLMFEVMWAWHWSLTIEMREYLVKITRLIE